MSSVPTWQSLLYPPVFCAAITTSLRWLFNWQSNNISPLQKLAAYPHLYSSASVKSVVHWFQIMRNAKFQMYDDDVQHVRLIRHIPRTSHATNRTTSRSCIPRSCHVALSNHALLSYSLQFSLQYECECQHVKLLSPEYLGRCRRPAIVRNLRNRLSADRYQFS